MSQIKIDLLSYQLRLLKSKAPYCALIGGTGSGKTFFLPRWLLVRMAEYPENEWIVSAPTNPMLKRNPLKYIETYLKNEQIPYILNKSDLTMEVKYPKGTVYFISAETPDRMQGIHAKGIIGDEAGLYDRLWWDTAVQRIAYQEGQILLTTTPYSMNWLKKEIWDMWKMGDPDFYIENPSSLDNPFYPKQEYERAKQRLPEWKFKMLFEGKFTKPAGLIYPEYHLVEPFEIPAHWYRFRGVDFGFNNPFATVWIAENPETEDMFVYSEYKKTGLTIDDMEKVLAKDASTVAYGDPASKETLETLKARGINIRPAKKDVLNGILYLGELLKTGKLKIFKNLKLLIDELDTYQWETDKTENFIDKPKKENDHLLDALRYAVVTYKTSAGVIYKPTKIKGV